jgi:predicted membrane protein
VNSSGLEDNTGLGINVTTKGETIEVRQLKKMNSPEIKIKVPKGVTIYYEHQSQYGGEVKFKNVESEIEVSTHYNGLEFLNITGPITVKAIYGGIDATFGDNIKGPISLVSVYGHVDVTIPASTKANLKLNTSYGEIFVAPEFNIDMDKTGEMVSYGDRISGKINGGGISIDLGANYSKIYLRKK